MRALLIS